MGIQLISQTSEFFSIFLREDGTSQGLPITNSDRNSVHCYTLLQKIMFIVKQATGMTKISRGYFHPGGIFPKNFPGGGGYTTVVISKLKSESSKMNGDHEQPF